MSQRGFALLAVLWTVTAITMLTGAAMAVARLGSTTTRNRLLLTRAGWAREACGDILQARWASPPDPLFTVFQAVVRRSGAVDSLVDALLDWRDPDQVPRSLGDESSRNRNGPLADVWELRYVRGFTDSLVGTLARVLTTRGTGAINVNAAPQEVLATLPGMTEETARTLIMHRGEAPLPNADVLAGLLSPSSRRALLASYPEFVRSATFAAPQLVGIVTGGVRGAPLVARVMLTVVPVAGRLAVIRRETE